jgi:hypothetical protein
LSDHAQINQRLADEGLSNEQQVWQSLKNR